MREKVKMKEKIKRFLKDIKWVIMFIFVAVMWLLFFYMIFGFLWEVAQFHVVMNSLAG